MSSQPDDTFAFHLHDLPPDLLHANIEAASTELNPLWRVQPLKVRAQPPSLSTSLPAHQVLSCLISGHVPGILFGRNTTDVGSPLLHRFMCRLFKGRKSSSFLPGFLLLLNVLDGYSSKSTDVYPGGVSDISNLPGDQDANGVRLPSRFCSSPSSLRTHAHPQEPSLVLSICLIKRSQELSESDI